MAVFNPKPFLSILATMVAHTRAATQKLTDFNVGSVTRSWLEANAMALDELWLGTAEGINAAIPESIYEGFGFDRLPATYAVGNITFFVDSAAVAEIEIPAGTVVRSLGGTIEYITINTGIIGVGTTEVTVPARAASPGAASNVPPDTLTVPFDLGAIGAIRATNRAPIDQGRDIETDAERELRFGEYIISLSRGTVAALAYAAKLARILDEDGRVSERVAHVGLREVPGTVWLYVHNGAGGTSPELVGLVETILEGSADYASGEFTPGYRSAGVEVLYSAATDILIDVEIQATLTAGYTAEATRDAAVTALHTLYQTFTYDFLSVHHILTALYLVPGMKDITVIAPVHGFSLPVGKRPVFGELSVAWR